MAHIPEALQPFYKDMQEAIQLYRKSRFDPYRDSLLKAFVETIHNDHSLQRFFQICVTVPLLLAEFQARFYLYDNASENFLCVADSEHGLVTPPTPACGELKVVHRAIFTHDGWQCYPLYPREGASQQPPKPSHAAQKLYDPDPYFSQHSLLGIFAVNSAADIGQEDGKLLKILTRWMGSKLNKRLIAERHLEHLKFLNSLGRDIGHNVIVPNMYLKHLLRQMEKQINELQQVIEEAESSHGTGFTTRQHIQFLADCHARREALARSHRELLKHHNQITLFIESLFREQHFSQGHLVLQPTSCFVERDIIQPQLDLYVKKLEQQGVHIDKPLNLYEQKFPLMVDVGLLSQVYANLFSNAVKYTQEIVDHKGRPRKAIAYGAEKVPDFPQPGRQGIKFNVFTTGPPLSEAERQSVFDEGTRAGNSKGIAGTGHGLDFIRRVIEVHGGRVGCESNSEGNNFYFILPISQENKGIANTADAEQR